MTPRIAEKIQVAETIGTISLALRSLADNQSDLDRAIAAGEVDLPDDASRADEERLLRTAAARPQDGASTFVTGGDVSRFQRSTMPRRTPQASSQAVAGPISGATVQLPSGPVVRVSRGSSVTIEPVGRGTSTLVNRTATRVGAAGAAMPSAVVAP